MMHEAIAAFLGGRQVATVCCTDGQHHPYCFNCFYHFTNDGYLLYFKSSESAHHSGLLEMYHPVAGTVIEGNGSLAAMKGAQFTARVLAPDDTLARGAAAAYHRRYPMALARPGRVWTLALETVKFTDNRLGIGKKLHWSRYS